MRVVVTGATGNVGTSVVKALVGEPAVESIVGIARRRPEWQPPKVEWVDADVISAELAPIFRGADVVIHLAWAIQPSRDEVTLRATNVRGSQRVFDAVAEAGVDALVHASSVGTYSPAPPEQPPVDESWPTGGIDTSFYSRQKAEVEMVLDRFEMENPKVRTVRMRPALIFKGNAAVEIRRLFAGPLLPGRLARPGLLPVFPWISDLAIQAVHSADVADAYRLAAIGDACGAFNLAAEPILDAETLGDALGTRLLPLPGDLVRGAASLTWSLRLQPTPPGWVDMARSVPMMDSGRARRELDWNPSRDAAEALRELLEGMADARDLDTPPLDGETSGPLRAREFLTGIGRRDS